MDIVCTDDSWLRKSALSNPNNHAVVSVCADILDLQTCV